MDVHPLKCSNFIVFDPSPHQLYTYTYTYTHVYLIYLHIIDISYNIIVASSSYLQLMHLDLLSHHINAPIVRGV
jgi:hypothetical protein